ncbi:ABC transporter ATP-binding protein [Lachnospira pectinoschiza]|uniref:ABC-2 type transport system ATP-binding protein n=1 Tax=Lachnospira pectinoschiza TaxID=28052 RepID=A0A1G9XSA2_9FIRM|nr:ABC transporter ATP-binding protein [Lachnospira pectinoschiza]SDM99674.1 ABC-2 type transport system ATP-binding protein [Lachnospira pectinoschiza]
MLVLQNVNKQYSSITAAYNQCISLEAGNVYALLGPNGSGKSTFMKMIAGLVKADSGQIFYKGQPLSCESKADISYMPTESYFYSYMTPKDISNYFSDFFADFNKDRFYAFLNDMQLPDNLKAYKMSTGMLAKLKIAVSLSRSSGLMMLDEPLNGIDIISRERMAATIAANSGPGRIMIVSSHLIDELEAVSTHAIFIKQGCIVSAGSIEELRNQTGLNLVDQYKRIYA